MNINKEFGLSLLMLDIERLKACSLGLSCIIFTRKLGVRLRFQDTCAVQAVESPKAKRAKRWVSNRYLCIPLSPKSDRTCSNSLGT